MRYLILFLLSIVYAQGAWANYCPNFDYHPSSIVVDSSSTLREAISSSEGNGANDRIFLVADTYLIDTPLVYLDRGFGEGVSLMACSDDPPTLQAVNNLIFRAYKGDTAAPCFGPCQNVYSSPFPQLKFVGLRFINGAVSADFDFEAAAIGANGFDVEVASSEFSNMSGHAISYGRRTTVISSTFNEVNGVAIYARLGSLRVEDSSFNSVREGIIASENYQLLDGVLIKNSFFSNGSDTAVDVRIDGDGDGFSRLEIIGSTFQNNKATPVRSYTANNLIRNSTFKNNINGILGPNPPMDTPFCIEHDFAPCSGGGAIFIGNYSHRNAITVIENSEFTDNQAPDYGGAIDFEGVRNCEVTYSREGAPCNANSEGPEYNLIVRGSRFKGNRSHRGAAIALGRRPQAQFFQKGNALIVDSEFDSNIATANPAVVPSNEPMKAGQHGPVIQNPPEDGMLTTVIDVGGRLEFSSLVLVSNTAEVILNSRSQVIQELFTPSAPIVSIAEIDDGVIVLSFTVEDSGGKDVTGYEATCTDGTDSFSVTSTSSPITVSGLSNDVDYTCTVTATNLVGQSLPSAPTPPITPEAVPNGLPVWLLYEATK